MYERSSIRSLLPVLSAIVLLAALPGRKTAAAQDRVFISSRGSNEIRTYDAETGDFLQTLFTARDDTGNPQEVVFAPDGKLLVTFRYGEASTFIHEYDRFTGDFIDEFSSGYSLDEPTKMRFGPDGHVYVSQWGGTRFNVAVFDGVTGEFLREATNDSFRRNLMEMAWDNEGRLYVSHWGDGSNGFVRRFDAEGNVESTVIGTAVLDGPVNIWFNEDGTLNVVDWTRGRVDTFDIDTGQQVGTRASGMDNAEGWTFGPDGLLYVCDWLTGDVNRYDAETGAFVDTFINDPGLVNPNSIKFEPALNVAAEPGFLDIPAVAGLEQNYPNPFSESTTITFSVPEASRVRLTVSDLLGRVVDVLMDDVRPAGNHSALFDAKALPEGVYVYRLETTDGVVSRVMTMIR